MRKKVKNKKQYQNEDSLVGREVKGVTGEPEGNEKEERKVGGSEEKVLKRGRKSEGIDSADHQLR